MRTLAISLILSSTLAGCEAYKSINLSNLSIGMSKSESIQALGRNPDNLIGAKQYEDGTVEVLQYSRYDIWASQLQERYWLYFFQ